MTINPLRGPIRAALEAPDNTPTLRRWLGRRLPALARSVRLPATAPLCELERFAREYMALLPDYLGTVERLVVRRGVAELARPLLALATVVTLDAVSTSRQRRPAGQLVDLLHMTYFAYRLLEETTDYCVTAGGGPQLPHETTVATLICHDLIGERLANDLDAAVATMVESCLVGRTLPRRMPPTPVHWPRPPHNLALAGRFGAGF